uniref:Uncharacterized protein n=1 Tax=Eutreptiella gymnastica TaxID=73025 RepID=A0A6U8BK89_9EUGL
MAACTGICLWLNGPWGKLVVTFAGTCMCGAAMDQPKIHMQTLGLPRLQSKIPNPGMRLPTLVSLKGVGQTARMHCLKGHLLSHPEMAFQSANQVSGTHNPPELMRSQGGVGGGATAAPNPCDPIYVHTLMVGAFLT